MNRIPLPLLLLLAPTSALASDDKPAEPVEIIYREQITNFWGGRETKLHLVVAAQEAFSAEFHWSMRSGGRTLMSRTCPIDVLAGGKVEVEIRCTLPTVKDAVVYPLELRAWADMAGKEPVAELSERLYLYGNNPFAGRRERLKSLQIRLFDPENSTAVALEKLNVPFERISDLAAIEELQEGVLIIGEDVAWEDYGRLGPTLLGIAARGVNVLCLPGAKAEFPLPTAQRREPTTTKLLSFRQTDVLRDLDKRLSTHWTGEHAVVRQALALVGENDKALARAVEPALGWPWMEVRFAQPVGKPSALVWCGLGLIRSWEESPTPRYALLSWLEKIGEQ